jgi:hypothetical protein
METGSSRISVVRGGKSLTVRSIQSRKDVAVLQQRVSHSLAMWVAWIVAGAAGSLLPGLPVFTIPFDVSNFTLYGAMLGVIVAAACLALFQYIVIRTLLARVSLALAMWIPVSVAATVAGLVPTEMVQSGVPGPLVSIGAIASSLPRGFPFAESLGVLIIVAPAALLGAAQGLVLSKVYGRRAVNPWVLANLLAAVVVGAVMATRNDDLTTLLNSQFSPDEATVTAFYLVNTLLSGALYAAVTGPVLLVLARHTPRNIWLGHALAAHGNV